MIASVFKRHRRRDGKLELSQSYYARIRLDGEYAVRTVCLNTSDKMVAEKKLADIVRDEERERAGIIAPKLERTSAQRALSEHIEEHVKDLVAMGRSPEHIRHVRTRLLSLATACGWHLPGDVSADTFVTWRSGQKSIGPKTCNDYLNSFIAFFNWMKRQGRVEVNPLENVIKADIRGHQQRRRAFTDEEFKKLIAVATQQKLLYLTAAYTGLRLGELMQLVWGDLKLDHERPHVIVRDSTTKNRRQATLPLHPQLLEALRLAKPANATDGTPVFSYASCHHAVSPRRFVADLAKAGIPKFDDMGRKLDFHCLRYTFATLLAKNHVSQRLAQELMRHSDPRLTANIYTDVTCLPTFEAVNELPWLGEERGMTQPQSPENHGTQNGTQTPVISGQNAALSVALAKNTKQSARPVFIRVERQLAGSVRGPKLAERGGFEPPVAVYTTTTV